MVKVTRKGQITIPAKVRKELGIKGGDVLVVETVDQKVTFKRVPKLEELAGVLAGEADVSELKKELEKLREEY